MEWTQSFRWTVYPAAILATVIIVWQTSVTLNLRPDTTARVEWRLPVGWLAVYVVLMGRAVHTNLRRHTRYTRKKAVVYYSVTVVANMLWALLIFRDRRLWYTLMITTGALLVVGRLTMAARAYYPEGAFLMALWLWGVVAWCINIYLLL